MFANMHTHKPIIECVKFQDLFRRQESPQWSRAESLHLWSRMQGVTRRNVELMYWKESSLGGNVNVVILEL